MVAKLVNDCELFPKYWERLIFGIRLLKIYLIL